MTSATSRVDRWSERLRNPDIALAIAIATVAFLSRLIPELQGELPGGSDYDEGVYFATANALTRGIVPYRDFVSIHPPGVPLLLTPIAGPFTALFGSTAGFLAARVLAALAGAITTFLIYRCALKLSGRSAAVIASLLYATFAAAIVAEGRVLLDPFMIMFGVAGCYVFLERQGRRAAMWTGVLLGLAVSMKLTGAVFLVSVLIVALFVERARRTDLAAIAASCVATAVVIMGPFIVLAGPRTFFSQVISAQLDRPTGAGLPGNIAKVTSRLSEIMAWGPLGNRGTLPLVLTLLLCAIAALATVWGFTRRTSRGALWSLTFSLSTIGLLTAPTFYVQYSALTGVSLAILLGGTCAWGLARLSSRVALVAVCCVAFVLVGWQFKVGVFTTQRSVPSGYKQLVQAAAVDGCIFTTDSDNAFLADVVPQEGVAKPLIDPFGELLDLGRNSSSTALGALQSEPSQQRLRLALSECPTVVMSGSFEEQFLWSEDTKAWFVATHTLAGLEGPTSTWRTN